MYLIKILHLGHKKIKEMNLIKHISIFLFAVFLFASCEYEPVDKSALNSSSNTVGTTTGGTTTGGTTSGGATTAGYYIKVTKDGALLQWSTIQAVNVAALNSFLISGATPSSSITLTMFDVPKTGVFKLSYAQISCTYIEGMTFYNSNYSDFTESVGDITVTELNKTNKTIKGTFNFIGKNDPMTATKVFTKGEFFVKYTEQ